MIEMMDLSEQIAEAVVVEIMNSNVLAYDDDGGFIWSSSAIEILSGAVANELEHIMEGCCGNQ